METKCKNQENKQWKNGELKKSEEDLPRLKECDLANAAKINKKKKVGCDGFYPKVPLDFARGTREEVVKFLEKVEQYGKWPQQACTTMFFLISRNVTSERPNALIPTMVGGKL